MRITIFMSYFIIIITLVTSIVIGILSQLFLNTWDNLKI